MAEEATVQIRMGAAYGMLAQYGNAELRERESEGFALAMREKYRETD